MTARRSTFWWRKGRPVGRIADHRQARAAVLWLIGAFVVSQFSLSFALEWAVPHWRDPEFARKLDRLRAGRTERPGAPLVVVLGSSRVYMGVRPGVCGGADAVRDAPVIFNGALIGAGPVLQLLALDRLLRAGERPDAVVFEFWPVYFLDRPDDREESRIDPNRLDHTDLSLVTRYADNAGHIRRDWRTARAVPSYGHRFVARSLGLPSWDPVGRRLDHNWQPVDAWGWKPGQRLDVNLSDRRARLAAARAYYAKALAAPGPRPAAVRAAEVLFDLCRQHGLRTALLWMPESSEFQAWYPPEADAAAAAILADWQQRRGVTVVNARDWSPDGHFADGFHLTPEGAAVFTARLMREALPNWQAWAVPSARPE
jgi:hypothetical protein